MITLFRSPRVLFLIAALALAACDESGDASYEPTEYPTEYVVPEVPAQIETVEDLFPATAARGLLLNRCAGCHSVACTALGQRTGEEWDAVEYSHENYIPGLSIEDRGKIFDYLKRSFGADQPEPNVPAHLLEGGCPELTD